MCQTLFPAQCMVSVATLMQGVFKQLEAFNDGPGSSTSHIPDPHQADPLNIINVALARQKAAVQAGCSGNSCADSSNLVNILYQRQQALLVQQQQRQQMQLPDQPALSTQAEVHANTNVHTADIAGNDAHADAEFPNSPRSFEGDTVPYTPVNGAAPLEAASAGDHGPDSRCHQEADKATADAEGIELVFDQVPIRLNMPNQVRVFDRCAYVPWCLNHPCDEWHEVAPALSVDAGLVSKFGQLHSEHMHTGLLTFNKCPCVIACCTLVGIFALHCSALFHDFIPANPVASQVSSSVAAATSRITGFLSMSSQLFVLFPLL